MAERWQQWYPHHIDNWQGSANVQALSDLAYRAIHNLLQDMWKQADCSLPNDDKDLAKRSRVAARWPECREEVMDYLELIDGKISNTFLKREWLEAQAIYAGRKERAKAVAARKKTPPKDDIETISKPHRDDIEVANRRSGDTVTETQTGTETVKKEQKPKQPRAAFVLPAWIDAVVWQAYEEMRGKIKKPLSDFARTVAVNRLAKFAAKGHDPTEILSTAILNCWQGVFEPKEEKRGFTQENRGNQRVAAQLEELRKAGVSFPAGVPEDGVSQGSPATGGGHGRSEAGVVLEGSG